MQLNDPFPIESLPLRARNAIKAEFGGRCPTVREVINVPVARWLTAPDIGPETLEQLHQIIQSLAKNIGGRS
jgi:hypothetical protein